jgi:ABC-type uncharacterized transport system substrate-binding protein
MQRREFIATVGTMAVLWPLGAWAQQQQGRPVVGFLSARSPDESVDVISEFRRGMRQSGFVKGQNITVAFRWAEGRYERLGPLAAELVGLRPAVIFAAGGPPSALAAKKATSSIPVVFVAGGDPVKLGLIASLNRPGGNVTGIHIFSAALEPKKLELLHELIPNAGVVCALVNPANPNAQTVSKELKAAGRTIGMQIRIIHASNEQELDMVFADWSKQRAGALVVTSEGFFDSERERIVGLSLKYSVAGIYPWREYVTAGGLMSYGSNLSDSYRQAGIYVARLLNGEKPSDLPSCSRASLSWYSTSRLQGRLGLAYRRRCSRGPMR